MIPVHHIRYDNTGDINNNVNDRVANKPTGAKEASYVYIMYKVNF